MTLIGIVNNLIPWRDDTDLMRVYAACQYIAVLMKTTAWLYPHAAFINKTVRAEIERKLNIVFSTDFFTSSDYRETFYKIYDELVNLSLKEFLLGYVPDFVTQIDRTFNILDNVEADIVDQCLLLIAAKREEPAAPDGLLDKEKWNELIRAVNCYAHMYQSRHYGAALKARKILAEHGLPAEYQIALYADVRVYLMGGKWEGRIRNLREKVADPAHYIRACKGRDPQVDIMGLDEVFNQAAEYISRIARPTDFLEALLVNKQNDDSMIECDFVHSKFSERLRNEDRVLVINPSVDFLLVYPVGLMNRTTFCVPWESMAEVLSHQFAAHFVSYDKLSSEGSYTKALLFSRELDEKTLDDMLTIVAGCLESGGELHALIPAQRVSEAPLGPFSIVQLDLLPQRAVESSPKKKVYLQAVCGQVNHETISLSDYEFVHAEGTKWLKKAQESPLELPQNRLYSGQTIYQIYRNLRFGQRSVKRRIPEAYLFSPEIVFWYRVYPAVETRGDKLEAYICYFPSEKQKKRRKLIRGNKVEYSYASNATCSCLREAYAWLEGVYPYKPCVHRAVREIFRKDNRTLRNGTVTLKSFWYLELDIKEEDKLYEPDLAAKELFASPVGTLPLKTEQQELEAVMEDYCAGRALEEQAQLWQILKRVFDGAVKGGYLDRNPAREMAETFQEKSDRALLNVRSALTKKTFHPEEERRLLEFLRQQIVDHPEYLSVLIRLYTGLEPAVVSALCWEDIRRVTNGVYQFQVHQRCSGYDDTLMPLEYEEDYRCVPITETLYAALYKRRREIKEKFSIDENDLKKIRVVVSNEKLQKKDSKNVTPRKINDLSRRAVQSIGIPSNTIELPDMDGGMQTTDLADYRGDIFRSNFWHHGNHVCGLTDAEIRFLLGIRQASTYAENYCDYENMFIQLGIYKKLRRWDIALRSAEGASVRETKKMIIGRTLSAEVDGYRANATVQMKVKNSTQETHVRIQCANGFSVTAMVDLLSATTQKGECDHGA